MTATCSDTVPVATPGVSPVNGSEQATTGVRRLLQGPSTTTTTTTIIDADLQFTGASSELVAQVSDGLAQNREALVPVFAAALPAGTDVATVRTAASGSCMHCCADYATCMSGLCTTVAR